MKFYINGDAYCAHGLKDNIVKMSVLLKLMHRFNIILIKTTARFFIDTDKISFTFMWNGKRARIATTILKKK